MSTTGNTIAASLLYSSIPKWVGLSSNPAGTERVLGSRDTRLAASGESQLPNFLCPWSRVKKDFEIAPFKTLDLYPLMCQLLGIVPQPNNGSLENVMPLLLQETTDPPTTDPPAPDPPTAGQAEVNMQGLPVLMAISICLPILIL